MFIYRSPDGRLNFSEISDVEAPVVSTYEPVSSEVWHHVVATMADVEEGCATFARGISNESPEEVENRIALYVDGFPYALELEDRPFPPSPPEARNIVGARDEGESSFGNYLSGTVDDVVIYDDALFDNELIRHLEISEAPPRELALHEELDPTDSDKDGVIDVEDNCGETSNSGQEDEDLNGVGDACQVTNDEDGDEVPDLTDNCPEVSNPLQKDEDEDGIGDDCDL